MFATRNIDFTPGSMASTIAEIISSVVASIRDDKSRTLAMAEETGPGVDCAESLSRAGFLEPEDSAAIVRSICLRLIDVGIDDRKITPLLLACSASASPDAAARNLDRYFDRIGDPTTFVNVIIGAPPVLDMITTVFGTSQYMADILVRGPGNVYWLMEKSTWDADDSVEHYRNWLHRETLLFSDYESKLNALRRTHRQALLKIGTLDLLGKSSIEETTLRLSNLAEAVAGIVLDLTLVECWSGEGVPPSLAVIAMGKLGSQELNYSSDIDLIYVCSDENEPHLEFLTRAARRFTESMAEVSGEGYLYRVDLRLRPDGKAGPMISTQTSFHLYYENRGRPWEFQALLKARVVAGDVEVARRVLDSLHKMIFSRSLTYSPLNDILQMREQIKDHIPVHERGFNIKLMAGGIRDIEFVTQALQLMHGAEHRDLRITSTLRALSLIGTHKLLKAWEVKNLVGAYRFFRLVEHRVQMMHQIKTHNVPESQAEIANLARRVSRGPLGNYDTDEFLAELSKHLNNVRAFADSFFEGKSVHPHSALLMMPADDERAENILKPYGFKDIGAASRTLHAMAYGSFPRLLDRRVYSAFEELLPLLLESVAPFGNPDSALRNLGQIAAAGKSESSFYRHLYEAAPARDLVCALAGFSSLLSKRVANQIDTLDDLLHSFGKVGFETQFREIGEWDRFNASLARRSGSEASQRQARQRAWFDRTRLHDFVSVYNRRFRRVSRSPGRSWVALRQLAIAFDSALGAAENVAVFALGSYAVEEARMTSDVDLIVITDGADVPAVTSEIQMINRWFTDGGVLKLDFRLRGEGASAPLVQDLTFYRDYFDKRISTWERLALSKCRAWWGSSAARSGFQELLRDKVQIPFTSSETTELRQMRARLETLAPKKFRTWDTKRSAGGRYDIDYIVALGSAAIASDEPDIYTLDSVARIEQLALGGFLSREDAGALLSALELFSLVEYLMELQELSHPTSIEKYEFLCQYMNRTFELIELPAHNGVEKRLEDTKRAVRSCFTRIMG